MSMRAVQIVKDGVEALDLKVSSIPKPKVGNSEILVRNTFSGLNFIDIYFRSGLYKKQVPFVLGQEGLGIIESIDCIGKDVDLSYFNFSKKSPKELVGRKIGYLNPGSYAEYTAVNYKNTFLVPETSKLSDEEVCSLILQGMTGHYLTRSLYKLTNKDVCLVQASAGGTGQIIVQLAKAAGAKVIGTCSTSKVELSKNLGCDLVLDYTKLSTADIVAEVKKFTDGKGVNIAYDGVGKNTFDMSLDCVKRRGTLCLFGNASGPIPSFDPLLLSQKGSLYLTRATLFDYIAEEGELLWRMSELLHLAEEGKVKVTIDKIFDLKDVGKAHEYLESGKSMGKILFRI